MISMNDIAVVADGVAALSGEPGGEPGPARAGVDETGRFLVDYISWLFGCGATCVRIEKNVGRIARSFGYECDITEMPRHVTIALTRRHGGADTRIFQAHIRPCGINFDINTRLSRLSWNIVDRHMTIEQAREELKAIVTTAYRPGLATVGLVSLANASFCRLFGGDSVAMLVVFVATAVGYMLKLAMLGRKVDMRLTFLACGFVSSVISAGASIFAWGTTPDIALATSVLYLIPGVPYLNAASDLIDKHYLCSLARFADAVVLTACLSLGLCIGIKLLGIDWF